MGLNLDITFGNTSLEEEELQELKIFGLTTKEDLNRVEQENINAALIYLQKRGPIPYEELLTLDFLKTLHEKMFGHVWLWAGHLRSTNKNIGVPKGKILMCLYSLLDDTRYQIAHETYGKDEIVLRCKHRLVYVHLFPNGNGRHSRMFADLLITSLGGKPFSWGVSLPDARLLYLQSLREADQGNYYPLLSFARR